jgi:hypothetical protein
MNSNFNTFGRKNLSLGRPFNEEDLSVSDEPEMAKAVEDFVETYEVCQCGDCMDAMKKDSSTPALRDALTETLAAYLNEVQRNALAMLDGDAKETTKSTAAKPYENYLEIHGVKSFNFDGQNVLMQLENDVDVFFNDVLQEGGKINQEVTGSVHLFMVGENIDLDMDLFFENKGSIFSSGEYSFGAVKLHSLSVTKIYGVIATEPTPQQMAFTFEPTTFVPSASPTFGFIQAGQQDSVSPSIGSEPVYGYDYYDSLIKNSILPQVQPAQTKAQLVKAAFISDEYPKSIGEVTSAKQMGAVASLNKATATQAQNQLMGYAGMSNEDQSLTGNAFIDTMNQSGYVRTLLSNSVN